LAQVPNIRGIKDSSGSFDTILQYLEHASTEFSVLSGNDGLILSTLMAGGRGTVSAMANIAPETVVAIYELWHKGEFKQAEEAQRVLRIARGALRLGTQPAALKAFLNGIGLPAGPARQPVSALSAQEQIQLEHIIKAYQNL
jgi:4-hydroxy-tetrahydrodipicolinate synthase